MKKLIVVLAFLLILTGCKKETQVSEQVEYVVFSGAKYHYVETESGYDLFEKDGHIIEINYGRVTTITTVIDGDIFIIQGDKLDYSITKNGTIIIMCSGEELICSGFESVGFDRDFVDIIEEYEKK